MKKIKCRLATKKNRTRWYIKKNLNDESQDFVTSYFAWKDMSEQKAICERLANITKKDK